MELSAPSHTGSCPAIDRPKSDITVPAIRQATIPWRNTALAPSVSFAPSLWATWTENPIVSIEHTPQNIHRLLFIRPTEADWSAPSLPTIEASMYCMRMVESWAIIAGPDSLAVNANCCRSVMLSPF